MLQLKDFMPVNFLKKEKYTGSCKGMRFRMEKFEKEFVEQTGVRVIVGKAAWVQTPNMPAKISKHFTVYSRLEMLL